MQSSGGASRRLKRSIGSEHSNSKLNRSSSKSRRKSSSRRRKQTPEQQQTTQAYELFANRHLRKIQEASHGVAVNTKYELTAANTNKLWSKFEADLLSRPNLNNIGADNDASR